MEIHNRVKLSGKHNFKGCRLQLPSGFNFQFLYKWLCDYPDKQVIEFLKYSFPVDYLGGRTEGVVPSNHKGAIEFPSEMARLINKEVELGGTLGPFKTSPFLNPRYSPLNSVPKRDSVERRLILDLSFPQGGP